MPLLGILIFRKLLLIDQFELLLPAGSIFGIALYVLIVNSTSYFIKGEVGIYLSYFFLFLILALLILKKNSSTKLNLTPPKKIFVYLFSIITWGLLIFWKGSFALIGSDTNLYYAVAHTFVKGNTPAFTPWQPGLPLAYHLGTFQLLGIFYLFTNLSFEFLHIFFSCFFILCSSQIIIWLWNRNFNLFSFLIGNLTAAITLISFGFLKVAIPISKGFPQVSNYQQFFLWIRNLPNVNQSIEGYGAPVTLDTLIYFIFHAFGLALILSLVVLINYSKRHIFFRKWILIGIGLSALALINESAFVISVLGLVVIALINDFQNKVFELHKKYLILSFLFFILLFFCGLILIQGGTITNLIFNSKDINKSLQILPEKSNNEALITYHVNQSISKAIPIRKDWLPFQWFSIGVDVLLVYSVISFIFVKYTKVQKNISITFLIMGISSMVAYYYVIPKYLPANGNRFLSFAFINLVLSSFYSIHNMIGYINQKFLRYLIFILLLILIITPTILPPLTLLTKTRFGENKLIPRPEEMTKGLRWIKDNLPFDSRVAILDVRAPHPSGMARVMVQSGVFAPVFTDQYRAYTIEASPEYLDLAFFLNPSSISELRINFILIDPQYFNTLPQRRKMQLEDTRYFKKIFDDSDKNQEWEKIYQIKDTYLNEAKDISGSFDELKRLNLKGKIYIDNEENFHPDYLRRAIIFSLRQEDLYYQPQSGVYLNVEADIHQSKPKEDINYDYLILGPNRNPQVFCRCQLKLIWTGLKDNFFVWQRT